MGDSLGDVCFIEEVRGSPHLNNLNYLPDILELLSLEHAVISLLLLKYKQTHKSANRNRLPGQPKCKLATLRVLNILISVWMIFS